MFAIIKKQYLNDTVILIEVEAPLIARKALPGQFVILRITADGERIPLTIADHNDETGTITLIFQIVGATTLKLSKLNCGDRLTDLVGPLGNASALSGIRRAIIIGGGVGSAIAYPLAKKLHENNAEVTTILGFRNKDLVIMESLFTAVSDALYIMTDDGSYAEKGLVTAKLQELLDADRQYDEVFAVGPLPMMKFVSLMTKKYEVKTFVSMNPIMIDGTGMCGGCRLTVGGKTVFACVDGPDFDGHLVDFDEAIRRGRMYHYEERHAYEAACHLFKKEVGA